MALLLMIRMNYHHQLIMNKRRIPCLDDYLDRVNLLLWPRFKACPLCRPPLHAPCTLRSLCAEPSCACVNDSNHHCLPAQVQGSLEGLYSLPQSRSVSHRACIGRR